MYGLPPTGGRYQVQQLISEVIHPDDRVDVEQHMAELERGKDVTFRVRRPDGEVRWMVGFSSTVEKREADGRPKQVLGFVKDVTAQAQLALEGRMLWQAVEQSPVPVVITDVRGQITYVNPAFTSMSGYRWSDVIGRNPRLLQSGETPAEVHQELWETITSGQQWRGELINSTKDGEIYHQATTIGPVRGPNSEFSHYVAVMEDITSRKQREAALERSHQQLAKQMLAQERELRDTSEALRTETVSRRHAESSWRRVEEELEQVFHTAAGGMRVIDRNCRVVRANENLSRMIGVPLSEMIGRKCWEDFSGPNCHTRRCTLRAVLAGAQMTGQEVTKITAKGREIACVLNVRELRDESGEVIGMVEDFQDLTEIRRLEMVAEAVNLMDNLSFVFAGVRHELGNPINALKTTISVLVRRLPELELESVAEYLERCQSDIRRVEYLLRSLKSFSMFENPVVEVLHLSTFLEKLEPLLRPDIEARGVSLMMPRSESDLWMRADPRALQQVMLNLVTNAMDACADRPAPEILLTAQRKDGLIELVLEDNGDGMNERQLNDLFKPFHTNKTNGTGLVAYLGRHHPRVPIVVMTAFGTPEMEANFRVLGVEHYIEKPIELEQLSEVVHKALHRPHLPPGARRLGPSAENLLLALREASDSALDGEVVIRQKQDSGRIFFHEGRVAWVVATTYSHTLMSHLVNRTSVTLSDLREVFDHCKRTRKNFGETIIEWGLLGRDTLRELLLEHISRGLAEVFAWPSSEVMFLPERRAFGGSLLYSLDEVLEQATQYHREARENFQSSAAPPPASDSNASDRQYVPNPPTDQGRAPAALKDEEGEKNMSDIIKTMESLKTVNGFVGAGAFTSAGELLGEVSAAGTSLAELGALANDVLLKSQQTTDLMGVGRGNHIHITAPKAHILVRCMNENTDFAANEPGRAHVHMMLILEPEGNIALGKMKLEKVIQQVAPLLR